ncbi:MAG: ATP-dependent DNA helicase RecG [Eubacteriales bacterium]
MKLEDKILELKGVGDKTAKLFQKLKINTVQELLQYYPREYQIYKPKVFFEEIKNGEMCAVGGKLKAPGFASRKIRNLIILSGKIIVDSNCNHRNKNIIPQITITFFNMPYIKKTIFVGKPYVFYGKLIEKNGEFIMDHPKVFQLEEYEKLLGKMQPIYMLTKGLTSNGIQKLVKQCLEREQLLGEYLPPDLLKAEDLISIKDAYSLIHFPKNIEQMTLARKRLAFDEFFIFMLSIRKMKEENRGIPVSNPLHTVKETDEFLNKLPYQLTHAQKNVWKEMEKDLTSVFAMNRLVQGDVGSGKTIVAFLGLLLVAKNGRQGSIMAPTEVLATQHYENFVSLNEQYELGITPVLLVGSMKAKEKREAYGKIASGEANIIVGTHALIQEKVIYNELALVVTDEQHRFGVRQREKLASKGDSVHVLVMSATPIPRTLAIILYGDLHISVIDEMPLGRMPIKNCVVNTSFRPKAYEFITSEIDKGRQAYVICPMVEEGQMEELENVVEYTEKLRNYLPPRIQIAYLHGKMKAAEKNTIMDDFSNGRIQVLVSTTVIEVGINVPNATVMMVENAERFGLAQLHQLRGRVGRGKEQSYCMFISSSDNKKIMDRLSVLNHSNDGFFIANEDLKSRGPGDLFGIRQSGQLEFKIADIYQDSNLLIHVSHLVDGILAEDPELLMEEHAGIKSLLERQLTSNIEFHTL